MACFLNWSRLPDNIVTCSSLKSALKTAHGACFADVEIKFKSDKTPGLHTFVRTTSVLVVAQT